MLTSEQKLLCAISHLSVLIGFGIIAPLIIFLVSTDPFVKRQSKEALAFQIVLAIAGVISGILCIILIGIPLLIAVAVIGIVYAIIATIKVFDGVDYSYPVVGEFVRKNF